MYDNDVMKKHTNQKLNMMKMHLMIYLTDTSMLCGKSGINYKDKGKELTVLNNFCGHGQQRSSRLTGALDPMMILY